MGRAQWTAVGKMLDVQEDMLRQAILSGFPTKGALDNVTDPAHPVQVPPADDALAVIGADRGLPRGSGETSANYAARLLVAWEQWKYGGAHYGLLRALAIAGFADFVVVQQNGRYSKLTGSSGTIADLTLGSLMNCVTRSNHPGWTFDWRDDFWTVFGVVFTADHANLQPNGDGSVSPGQALLTAMCVQWRQSKDNYDGAAVILAGRLLGWPTGRLLGTEPNLGGNSVRIIPGDGTSSFVLGP
jgi:hypothetical protein